LAARRHWKFTVRDQFGYVIQNALVYVYQPGTTTVFTGTCYNAASGGGTITNPFTSNDQGEVEGWFDTAQVVDVLITDNSDLAYRATSPTVPISFTSFTEKDDIYVSASDEATAIGTSGDITDIDAGDATAAGASGRFADAAHQHEYTTLPNSHGAASHNNIGGQLFIAADLADLGTGSAIITIGAGLNISRVVEYSDAASEDATWTFQVPDDWASGAISVQPVWSPGATDGVAHTVRWNYTAKNLSIGTDVTAAGTTTTWTGASAARTVNILVFDTSTSTGVTPASAGDFFLLNVQRIGGDGADTYVGTVRLHGLIVNYTANQ
jgi:hypothetical protein